MDCFAGTGAIGLEALSLGAARVVFVEKDAKAADLLERNIEMLGAEAAFVRGEFHLTMPDGKTPHGLFTLVFRKFPEGWKIVHDHSAGE